MDFTKRTTANLRYAGGIRPCPKCGKDGLVVDDPLVSGAKVYVHEGTFKGGILEASRRCTVTKEELELAEGQDRQRILQDEEDTAEWEKNR